VLHTPNGKFFSMWGRRPWVKRGGESREPSCWGGPTHAQEFFASALAGNECKRNWYEGAAGGDRYTPPRFRTRTAPVLYGDDPDIFALCSRVTGQPTVYAGGGDYREHARAIASRCVDAQMNILRLTDYWDMCINLEWMMCGLLGQLPGQEDLVNGEVEIKLATSTRDLDLNQFYYPPDCWSGPCSTHYAVRDVFFAEVFVLYQLCASTRDRLFEVGVGTSFKCKLDVDRYHELALWLQQSFT